MAVPGSRFFGAGPAPGSGEIGGSRWGVFGGSTDLLRVSTGGFAGVDFGGFGRFRWGVFEVSISFFGLSIGRFGVMENGTLSGGAIQLRQRPLGPPHCRRSYF